MLFPYMEEMCSIHGGKQFEHYCCLLIRNKRSGNSEIISLKGKNVNSEIFSKKFFTKDNIDIFR